MNNHYIAFDNEGIIRSASHQACSLLGFKDTELINTKRISAIFPGIVCITRLGKWIKSVAPDKELKVKSPIKLNSGKYIAAELVFSSDIKNQFININITPLPDENPEELLPGQDFKTRIAITNIIIRAPFLTASLIPVAIGAAYVYAGNPAADFSYGLFLLILAGIALVHISANLFNDYFDWKSGTDQKNADYFAPFSGGSRSIELGLITHKGLWNASCITLALAVSVCIILAILKGPVILIFGLTGALSTYFYTAPPVKLKARKGLGELFACFNFGPLPVAGTIYVLSGSLTFIDFLIGLPIGLFTTAILWINEFPDSASDELSGYKHLVVVLGKKHARWGYLLIIILAFAMVIFGVIFNFFPYGVILLLLAFPVAVYSNVILYRHYNDRLLIKANDATIKLQMIAGIFMILGLFLNKYISLLFS